MYHICESTDKPKWLTDEIGQRRLHGGCEMRLRVISTGSSGNGYVISDENDNCIVIEAGVNRKELKLKKAPEGFLVSHEHSDHAKFEMEYKAYFQKLETEHYQVLRTENFMVTSFPVVHNVQNQGFVIYSKIENKTLFFATDIIYNTLTKPEYKQPFKFLEQFDFDLVVVECNYNLYEFERATVFGENTFGNKNHMSEIEAARFMSHLKLEPSTPILLIHKSSRLLVDEKHTINFLKKRFKNDFAFAKNQTIVKF